VRTVIDLEGLSIAFGDTVALRELTLQVEAGAIFGFLGPNGAGKTTTIRLMLGLLTPDAGACRVMGFDARTDSHRIRAETGALLEHPGVYERLTVEENLTLFGRINRLGGATLETRIAAVLERFDLASRQKDRAGALSKGMRQKLGVARAVLHGPKLLVLDEPTSGLDPESASRLRADLVALADEGVTVFLTTHDLAEVQRICTRVAVVESGKIRADGTVEDLLARVGHRRYRVRLAEGVPGLAEELRAWDPHASFDMVATEDGPVALSFEEGRHSVPDLVELLVRLGARIQEVSPAGSELETAYLHLLAESENVA